MHIARMLVDIDWYFRLQYKLYLPKTLVPILIMKFCKSSKKLKIIWALKRQVGCKNYSSHSEEKEIIVGLVAGSQVALTFILLGKSHHPGVWYNFHSISYWVNSRFGITCRGFQCFEINSCPSSSPKTTFSLIQFHSISYAFLQSPLFLPYGPVTYCYVTSR